MSESARILKLQREFFNSGATLPVEGRKVALHRLLNAVTAREAEILAALQQDLGKAPMEGYLTEVGIVKAELRTALKHLNGWARPRVVPTPLTLLPAVSKIYPEPYGVVLVQSPWNYPFQLCIAPVAGALAAGNCVMIKPSSSSPATAAVIEKLIGDVFEERYVHVLKAGGDSHEEILAEAYDYIIFTGSQRVGRVVMEAAAKHLTPVTLELGGKSPCIVEESADIPLAAKRVAFGKFLNAGQTCVAPDHVLVQRSVKDAFVRELTEAILSLYGPNPLQSPDLPKIINAHHFKRLVGLIEGQKVAAGGVWDEEKRKIAPTVLVDVTDDAPVMQDEIFGPVLPVLTFDTLQEVVERQQALPKPLALYLFTRNPVAERKVTSKISYGGGCINDTVMHLANDNLPFGGVGASGMGAYHGKASFETFSHYKSVLKKANILDLPQRYAPYTQEAFAFIKKFMK